MKIHELCAEKSFWHTNRFQSLYSREWNMYELSLFYNSFYVFLMLSCVFETWWRIKGASYPSSWFWFSSFLLIIIWDVFSLSSTYKMMLFCLKYSVEYLRAYCVYTLSAFSLLNISGNLYFLLEMGMNNI